MYIVEFLGSKDKNYALLETFSLKVNLENKIFIPVIGDEATNTLEKAFYESLAEQIASVWKRKFPGQPLLIDKKDQIEFTVHNEKFYDFIVDVIMGINKKSKGVISYVKDENLQDDTDQRKFWDTLISGEILALLLATIPASYVNKVGKKTKDNPENS